METKKKIFYATYELVETKIVSKKYWLEAQDEVEADEYMARAASQHSVIQADYERVLRNIQIKPTDFEYKTTRWMDVEKVGFKNLMETAEIVVDGKKYYEEDKLGLKEDAEYYFKLAQLLDEYKIDEAYEHFVNGDTVLREVVPQRAKDFFTILLNG